MTSFAQHTRSFLLEQEPSPSPTSSTHNMRSQGQSSQSPFKVVVKVLILQTRKLKLRGVWAPVLVCPAEPGYHLTSVSTVVFSPMLCAFTINSLSGKPSLSQALSHLGIGSRPPTPNHLFKSQKSPLNGPEISGAPMPQQPGPPPNDHRDPTGTLFPGPIAPGQPPTAGVCVPPPLAQDPLRSQPQLPKPLPLLTWRPPVVGSASSASASGAPQETGSN